jgi:TolB-like protein/tetratricopeptide (TPR) repeat protein
MARSRAMAGAVFLSYASEDSGAARRIGEGLRAAGCEVWIDQSELHGGDAWDATIRGQIRECALFVPVISTNTNARLEGYFRREWKQAVERTHDMDESLPFLVPVVIDATTDAEARVPEKFKHYQWTRLPGGEVPPAFVARVRKLLEGEAATPAHRTTGPTPPAPAAGRKPVRVWPFVVVGLAMAAGSLAIWRPWRAAVAAPPPVGRVVPTAAPAPAGGEAGVSVRAPPPVHPIARDSVAVLAFANGSGDKESEYFSDGISEDLIDLLSKVTDLKVAARTSAFSFKGRPTPIADIAKDLGVAFVVKGSVQRADGRVRITTQLVKAADDFEVRSDRFDREMKDIFVLEDEIAGLIARNLPGRVDEASPSARPGIGPEAYQLFLEGRARAERAGHADLTAAIDLFRRATALEPNYAAAWAQMARANVQLARWGAIDPAVGFAEARKAVDKAVALEPDLPAVQIALGWVRRTADLDWKGARQAFQRALDLEPGNPQALADVAILLFNVGLTDEGIRDARRAVDLDPLNAATNVNLCVLLERDGQMKKAEQAMRRALMLASDGQRYHGNLSMILSSLGRTAEARQEAALEKDPVWQKAAYAKIAVSHGAKERAVALARQLEELAGEKTGGADGYGCAARIYSTLDEKDRAFAALGQALSAREPGIAWLKGDPDLVGLHGDPRWTGMLTKARLADSQLR